MVAQNALWLTWPLAGETRVSSGENNLLKDHSDLASIPCKLFLISNFSLEYELLLPFKKKKELLLHFM